MSATMTKNAPTPRERYSQACERLFRDIVARALAKGADVSEWHAVPCTGMGDMAEQDIYVSGRANGGLVVATVREPRPIVGTPEPPAWTPAEHEAYARAFLQEIEAETPKRSGMMHGLGLFGAIRDAAERMFADGTATGIGFESIGNDPLRESLDRRNYRAWRQDRWLGRTPWHPDRMRPPPEPGRIPS